MGSDDVYLIGIGESIEGLEKTKAMLRVRLEEARDRGLEATDSNSVWQLHLSQSSNEKSLCEHRSQLAQHQLAQSYAKLKALRSHFEQKNETLKALQKQIDSEKEKQKEAASDLELELEKLCERFRSLKCQNSSDSLSAQILVLDDNCASLKKSKASEKQKQMIMERKLEGIANRKMEASSGGMRNWSDLEMTDEIQVLVQKVIRRAHESVSERVLLSARHLKELEIENETLS